jgi:hypothetical protein
VAKKKAAAGAKITFANGRKASYILQSAFESVDEMITALGLDRPEAVILNIGGASGLDAEKTSKLSHMYSAGLSYAAEELDALVIDGGTDSGVMAMMGKSLASLKKKLTVLGIAPEGKVLLSDSPTAAKDDQYPLEPHHSSFILANSDTWGGETDLFVQVARAFAFQAQIVVVLANGGDISKTETLRCARQGWPIVILKGSGRFADELADFIDGENDSNDPVLTEIAETGDLHFYSLEDSPFGLKELVLSLGMSRRVLIQAWDRFNLYDYNATIQQHDFMRLQKWMLRLAVFGTFLALTQTQIELEYDGLRAFVTSFGLPLNYSLLYSIYEFFFRGLIIMIPISVSVLMSLSNQRKAGNKWIFLRSGAEEIKQEIYKYRTFAGIYSLQNCTSTTREIKLAQRLKVITRRIVKTEVNLTGLKPYDIQSIQSYIEDDALDDITPSQYIKNRLDDQRKWFQKKTVELEHRLNRVKFWIFFVGGAGTFLAAIGLELWIALTTAIAGALATFLEYRQTETLLMSYNQTANDLSAIRDWWLALSIKEQQKNKNIDKLVTFTENTLSNESSGWVQQMQDMLDELQQEQAGDEKEEK